MVLAIIFGNNGASDAAQDVPLVFCVFSVVDRLVTIFDDPYDAIRGTHAFAVCTEWDEFKVFNCSSVLIIQRKSLFFLSCLKFLISAICQQAL